MVGLVKRRGGLFHQSLLCIPSDTRWSFDKNSRHLYLLVVLVSSTRTIEPIKRVRCAAFIITPTVGARKHFLKSACLLLVERRMPESTLRKKNIYDMARSWTQTWQLTRVITASVAFTIVISVQLPDDIFGNYKCDGRQYQIWI